MKQLQELLQSKELRHKVHSASDEHTALRLVREAATDKGYEFSLEWVKEAFDDVKIARQPAAPTESELLLLGSTYASRDTAPQLCHTDSCGGRHSGCCPTQA